MQIIAYLYSDPLLEPTPDPAIWGWDIDRVYQDRALVQNFPCAIDRPQWRQLIQDCQHQPADYLLVQRWSDLGESMQSVGDRLAEVESLGLRLIVLESEPDGGTASRSQLPAEVLGLCQQIQSNQRSRRIRQGHARNRVKAMPPPGRAPYGYRRSPNKYMIDRTTAPIVKAFFEQFLLYGSLRGAVRYLAKKYNKKIAVSTGQRWLTHPVYRGDLEYQNGEIIPDTHAAIMTREEAAQIDRLLRRNRRLPPRTATAPRSLAGLVICSKCQSSMTVTHVAARNPRQGGEPDEPDYLYLRPTACPNQPKCRAIAYETVLQATIEQICQDLPQAVSAASLPDLDRVQQHLRGKITANQEIVGQLPGLLASGILDQETADLRRYKLQTEIAQLQNQLAQLPPANLRSIAQAVSLPQFWRDLSEAERRFYFREFIRQIELVRQEQDWHLHLRFIF